MRRLIVPTMLASAALLGSAIVSAQDNSGKRYTLSLDGQAEVPVPGDPDGSGTATLRINPGQKMVCYSISVEDIEPATGAHIHEAPMGSAGPVVVHLIAPTNGMSQGCADISRDLALELIRNPDDYYINIHNANYPGGALRAQLDD
jgi:hypothetical protein